MSSALIPAPVREFFNKIMGNAPTHTTTVSRKSKWTVTSADDYGSMRTEHTEEITENGRSKRIRSEVTESSPPPPSPDYVRGEKGFPIDHVRGEIRFPVDHMNGEKEGFPVDHMSDEKGGFPVDHVRGEKEGFPADHVRGRKGFPVDHDHGEKACFPGDHDHGEKACFPGDHDHGEKAGFPVDHDHGEKAGFPIDHVRGEKEDSRRHGHGRPEQGTSRQFPHHPPGPDAQIHNSVIATSQNRDLGTKKQKSNKEVARMEGSARYTTRNRQTAQTMVQIEAESEKREIEIARSILNNLAMNSARK